MRGFLECGILAHGFLRVHCAACGHDRLDGVYERYGDPGMRFRLLPPPDNAEVRRVVLRVARRVGRLLERRGLGVGADPSEADPLGATQPLLAGLAEASLRGRAADGRPLARRGDRVDPEHLSDPASPRCAADSGFTLHADVAVPARDRRRLERLCRYGARPPVATQRLERLEDGRLNYRLRHRWRDGTTHIVFEPHELLERLVPLIPAPHAHLVRYHGVLAPCAGWRDRIVPETLPSRKAARLACCSGSGATKEEGVGAAPVPDKRRYAWADLLRRVFEFEVLDCPECGGRLRIIAAIHAPEATRAILECLGLPSRALPATPARSTAVPADY